MKKITGNNESKRYISKENPLDKMEDKADDQKDEMDMLFSSAFGGATGLITL